MKMLGPSTVSLEAAQAYALHKGAHDRFVRVAPLYWKHAPRYGEPAEALYMQAGKETNWGKYTGVVGPERHNWAGIKKKAGGGNNDPDAHAEFPNDEAGVLAHVQHWGRYARMTKAQVAALGDEILTPRWDAITDFADEVEQLGGPSSWAPDEGYGADVVKRTNDLISFANDGSWGPEPMSDMPGVPFIPADERHFTKGRRDPWPTQIIGHHSDGFDSLDWLTKAAKSTVSATMLLWHDGTIRAQLVRFADTPHTTGYKNDDSLSFEWERFWATQKAISTAQYRNIAQSVAIMYAAERKRGNPFFAGPMQRHHLADHNDFYDTACPGNLDLGLVFELAAPLVDPAKPPVEDVIDLNGYQIVLGFKGFWRELAVYEPTLPFRVLGYPLGNEISKEEGVAYQEFERGWLKWDRDEPPPWHIHLAMKGDHP